MLYRFKAKLQKLGVRFWRKAKGAEDQIYICLTVLPDRLNSEFFIEVIKHLKRQTISFDKIIISIPHIYKRTNQAYLIPQWLENDPEIQINRCEDFGPATKLLGIYDQLKYTDIICIVDDDIIYLPTMLENLLVAYRKRSNAIISTFVDKQGSPTGYSGYLFQKRSLEITQDDIHDLTCHCFFVDDTWLGKIARKKKVAVVGVSRRWQASMDKTLTDMHPEWFELSKNTQRAELVRACLCDEITEAERIT